LHHFSERSFKRLAVKPCQPFSFVWHCRRASRPDKIFEFSRNANPSRDTICLGFVVPGFSTELGFAFRVLISIPELFMKRLCLALLLLLGYSFSLIAQTSPTATSAQTGAATEKPETFEANTILLADLATTVDASKARPGDVVKATLRGDTWGPTQKLLLGGSTLIGHVVEAHGRTRENPESKLALCFDKAVSKDGSERQLNLTVYNLVVIEPVMRPIAKDDGLSSLNDSMARAAGPVSSGAPNGRYPDRATSQPAVQEPIWSRQRTPSSSRGPSSISHSGIPGVELASMSLASQSFSIFTSTHHDVKLKKHMLIYLQVVPAESSGSQR
jgi:hypothetical protein